MNRQITRVAVVGLVLLAALDRRDDLLAGLGRERARRPAGQLDPARRRVQGQAREDLRRRRADGARGQRQAQGRRADALLPPLPPARARGAHRRLLDPGALAGGARALGERLPDRVEHEPEHGRRHDARQAEGHDGQGQRPPPDAAPRRAAGRPRTRSAASAAPPSRSSRARAGCSSASRARPTTRT